MKNKLYVFVGFFAALLAGSSAYAAPAKKAPMAPSSPSSFFFKPYVGADYQYTSIGNANVGSGAQSDDVFDTSLHGGSAHVGARIHENLGFELGYFQTESGERKNVLSSGLDSELVLRGATFDAMGYLPVSDAAELIGTAGISYTEAELTVPTLGKSDTSEWQPRLGGGAQYWVNKNVNTRALVRYQWADFDNSVEDAVVASVGVNWQF